MCETRYILTHSSTCGFTTRCKMSQFFFDQNSWKNLMQQAKINFMFKSTITSNGCPSLPKLWYARPFFSSLNDTGHVCNCTAKAQRPCATIPVFIVRGTSFHASTEERTYQLQMLLCIKRISVLDAPSLVCSCPDTFTFLYTTPIMWVLVKANHGIIRNLEVVLRPNHGEW